RPLASVRYTQHPAPPSLPTRRSSDLSWRAGDRRHGAACPRCGDSGAAGDVAPVEIGEPAGPHSAVSPQQTLPYPGAGLARGTPIINQRLTKSLLLKRGLPCGYAPHKRVDTPTRTPHPKRGLPDHRPPPHGNTTARRCARRPPRRLRRYPHQPRPRTVGTPHQESAAHPLAHPTGHDPTPRRGQPHHRGPTPTPCRRARPTGAERQPRQGHRAARPRNRPVPVPIPPPPTPGVRVGDMGATGTRPRPGGPRRIQLRGLALVEGAPTRSTSDHPSA